MVGEELRAHHQRAGRLQRGHEFLRPPDAGKGEDPLASQEPRLRAPDRARKHRSAIALKIGVAVAPSRSPRRRAQALAHGFAQGPGRDHQAVAEAGLPSTTTSDKILGEGEILVAVIHHDDVGAARHGERRALRRGRAPRWWARPGQQQGFVAHCVRALSRLPPACGPSRCRHSRG